MAGASDSVPRSSILRKQVVALTGILLVGYVVMHLAGNTLLFAGPDASPRSLHNPNPNYLLADAMRWGASIPVSGTIPNEGRRKNRDQNGARGLSGRDLEAP